MGVSPSDHRARRNNRALLRRLLNQQTRGV
jgi:hypothetical protein